jgi:hypothetical protein
MKLMQEPAGEERYWRYRANGAPLFQMKLPR